MFRVNLQEVFDRVEVDPDDCQECPYLVDLNNFTYECKGNKFDCHQVSEKVLDIESFMEDNAHMFELIEEIK